MKEKDFIGRNKKVFRFFYNFLQKWLLWDLNPRPFGMAPKATALDHSAKQPDNFKQLFKVYKPKLHYLFIPSVCELL